MRTSLSVGLLALALNACPSPTAPTTAPTAPTGPAAPATTTTTTPQAPTATGLGLVREVAPSALPIDVSVVGNAVRALSFGDKNGENLVIFSQEKEKSGRKLHVIHVVGGTAQRKELRHVQDGIDACDLDLFVEFVPASIEVSDIDADGVGEISFAYKTGCISDVSPLSMKLLVLENGEKWILRGNSVVDLGDGKPQGGDFVPDPAASWPTGFMPAAEQRWKRALTAR